MAYPTRSKPLADELRRKITSGELTGRLPSMLSLSEEHGMAVSTVQRAVQALRREGLVRTLKGSGVYVERTSPTMATCPVQGCGGSMEQHGYGWRCTRCGATAPGPSTA
ncbi:winged helix-turn-helix domain-containing protein [Streptomyces lycii]|uniref:GntR family transcriptional regulator n=1 Tax=Streptomyces lycii TaxID=2654337 RepID=A0ABQ7FJQ1_9ACTN|nr:winged helix-turn-helix domain-containing protein [Streptomyces lycii]KAF4408605.1 GntR family transcriptional regulator [Streptomyces lycii]